MSKSYRKDLAGQRFGRLTVLEFVPNDEPDSYWKCQCDCGNIVIVRSSNMQCGYTKSCGCLQKEEAAAQRLKDKTKHRACKSRLYRIWHNMKERCYNKNNTVYDYYGGRGITVCDEWKNDFIKFAAWAQENGYDNTLTIDRINTEGNYEPSNCRWITQKEQTRNTRRNVFVEYNEQKMTLAEAAKKLNISYTTLMKRYNKGDRGDRLFRPVEIKFRSRFE